MIQTKIEKYDIATSAFVDITAKCVQPLQVSWRLDRELDGGSFSYYERGITNDKINEPFTLFRVTIYEQNGETITDSDSQVFVGMDERTALNTSWGAGANVGLKSTFKHDVSLTEATKLLEGVLIDGMAVTQPEANRKSLVNVVQRLLAITPCRKLLTDPKYSLLNTDENIRPLTNTISPQFKWNTQSTLWECLLEVGSVINALPELIIDGDGGLEYYINFIPVNEKAEEVTTLVDDRAYSYGENLNAEQANSGLSSVAENIREE